MENYDPRMEFYKKALDFLFKQTPAIIICFVACFVMFCEMSRRETQNENRIKALNLDWSKALNEAREDWNEAREDWRMCEEKREQLAIRVAKLEAKKR